MYWKLTGNNLERTEDTLGKKDAAISHSSSFVIPTFIFHDDRLTALEAIVTYLKEKEMLNYHAIGVVLNRDERNIWTVYNRSKKKRGIADAAK